MQKQNPEEENINIVISHMDYLLIENVKQLRLAREISQVALSQKMHLSEGFVGKVELLTNREKYNVRHFFLLAEAFNCSIQEILPLEQPIHDMVKLILKRTNKINKDGSLSAKKITEVIGIEPIKAKQP